MLMYYMMEVMTINKFIKMLLVLLSYVVMMFIVYNFTDIYQQNGGFEQMTYLIVSTTVYSYILSSIDNETFRFKFNWFLTALYVIGVIGFIISSGLNQNTIVAWLSSLISTAFLITGVVGSNG
ncbi:hypothetical protein DEDGFLLK_00047 [Lactiplantibacillus phage Gut-P1]|nr:hypothetical protein DEDGFLLK_00047 [Lactiplantibacillus phage Gut-P1]